jgi:hypothetical protein
METGGVRINVIPREGGNKFAGSFFGTGANSSFQGNNYTAALKAAGLTVPNSIYQSWDINPSFGGPIVSDRLWFFSSAYFKGNKNYIAGLYDNLNAGNPSAWTYAPDLSQQAIGSITQNAVNTRLTWQATPKNKFSLYVDNEIRNWNSDTSIYSPESATVYQFPVERLMMAGWSSPISNRLLVEAHLGQRAESYRDFLPPGGIANNTLIAVQEQSGLIPGLWYRGGGVGAGVTQPYYYIFMPNVINAAASLSYVTGAHAFKVGFTDRGGTRTNYSYDNACSCVYRFNNGVPNQIWERATPFLRAENLNADMGIYVQDKWTLKRLTVNAGLRFDYLNFGFPQEYEGPGPLVPNRNLTFPEIPSFVSHRDLNPRLGIAYDLFGNGKTAVKASASRYVIAQGASLNTYSDLGNPVLALANVVTRSWKDSGAPGSPNYFIPQCNLLNPLANGDCGTLSDVNFGTLEASTTFDPAVLKGFDVAPYAWEFSTSVQHELAPRVSVNLGYYRRIYGNFLATDNLSVAPSDYSPFSIAAPADARLPGGGGYVIGGLYNLNPNKVGQVNNYITSADNFGTEIEHWNGVDASVNIRLPGEVVVQGGLSTGRTMSDTCSIAGNQLNLVLSNSASATDAILPIGAVQSTQMCHLQTPFLTQVKLLGTYTVPKVDVHVAATFQSLPGPIISANYNAPNALVQPSLGRPLSGGAANTLVNLIAPGTLIGQQANLLNLRFGKAIKLGRVRTDVNLDLYNVTNSSPVLTLNSTYTPTGWQTPQGIMNARLFKISVQVNF